MVVCSIMEIILKSVITEQPNSTVSILYPDDDDDDEPSRYFNPVQQAQVNTVKQVIGPERLKRIVRAHIAWDISDAAFITVENSLMQAMRTCLTPWSRRHSNTNKRNLCNSTRSKRRSGFGKEVLRKR
eukprot:CAMPEP_0168796280 /NCGR_PEP_ID=MMETSP0725-20121227/16666_1 /TAXON_ID=265536 /ORGANISM="Amphiprora sp., Strain CCMP467" /LENGTH=127 /DNA_ID=CAMNT_0008847375 /DNA_START=251 /DNA_END=631 /DNA_ORIENTATION=+